jgi:hypothetical protein
MRWRIVCTIALTVIAITLGACHKESGVFHWITPEAVEAGQPPLPTVAPTVAPAPTIKGNIDAQGRKIYHVPGSPNYNQVVIDESKGERMFYTEAEAVAAGWTKAGN